MCGTSSMCFTPNMMAKYPMNVTFDQKHFKNACSHTHTLNSTVIQSVDIWCNTLCDALRMRMAKQKKTTNILCDWCICDQMINWIYRGETESVYKKEKTSHIFLLLLLLLLKNEEMLNMCPLTHFQR